MNNKQFVAREQMRAKGNSDAEMTGPGMHTDSDYKHEKGTGGMGGSPTKFIKREGSLENKNMSDCSRHMRGK